MNDNGENKPRNVRRQKEFLVRNSPLTDKLENNEDIRTIYNLFVLVFISLFANVVVQDYVKKGESSFGLRPIAAGFNRLDLVLAIWCFLNFLACATFFCFRFWASVRISLNTKSVKLWDRVWIFVLIAFILASFAGIQKVIEILEFAPPSASILAAEQIRLLMKEYSFIRTNVPHVLNFKSHSDKTMQLPKMEKFLYFLFAPTLLYRDEYPRTRHVRWKFVFYSFSEVFAIIYLFSLLVEIFLWPLFADICLRKFTLTEAFAPVITHLAPATLLFLGCFYSMLHAFQNAMAELLRFGDRMFYGEWWTSKSLTEYFRTWNILVHDWLFTYIYKDVYEIVAPKSKFVAQSAVFLISAVVHEWILFTVLGLFLPIFFFFFFVVEAHFAVFRLIYARAGNLLVWCSIMVSITTMFSFYALEFFAKTNCSVEGPVDGFDWLKPKFFTCGCIG